MSDFLLKSSPRSEWIDQYSGTPYRITTEGHHGARGVARVKTYGDVFEEYEWHPEYEIRGRVGCACRQACAVDEAA